MEKLDLHNVFVCESVCKQFQYIARHVMHFWPKVVFSRHQEFATRKNLVMCRIVTRWTKMRNTHNQLVLQPPTSELYFEQKLSIQKLDRMSHVTARLGENCRGVLSAFLAKNADHLIYLSTDSAGIVHDVSFPRLRTFSVESNYFLTMPQFKCPALQHLSMPTLPTYLVMYGVNLTHFLLGLDHDKLLSLRLFSDRQVTYMSFWHIRTVDLLENILAKAVNLRTLCLRIKPLNFNEGGAEVLAARLQKMLEHFTTLESLRLHYDSKSLLAFEVGYFAKLIRKNLSLQRLIIHNIRIHSTDIAVMNQRNVNIDL